MHFLAILDYGRPCDLASEVDGENGEDDVGDFGMHIASRVFGRNRRCAAFFGDPKARVIGLNRRSKKPFVVVAVAVRRAGTIIRFAGCAICRAATRGFSWNWRCAGSTVATAAG